MNLDPLSQLGIGAMISVIFYKIIIAYFEYQKNKDGLLNNLSSNIDANTKATGQMEQYLKLRNGHLEEVLKEVKGKE